MSLLRVGAASACPARRRSWQLAASILSIALASAVLWPVAARSATRLTGRVVDAETQKPIANALVELANASGGPGYFRDRTSGSGEFSLENIGADRSYTLSVSADGYADFVLGYWQIPSAQRAAEVVVPLDRAGSIAVRLTRGDGKTPVAGARVTARTESPSPWWSGRRDEPASAFSDKRGMVRFIDLKAGLWTVQAEAAGVLSAEARRVSVRRGEQTSIALALPRPASLSGTLRLADGTPVADVPVVARGPGEGVGASGAEGDFSITDLKPGKYRVEVQHDGFQPARSAATYTLGEGGSREGISITVTPRAPELAFALPREVFGPEDKVELPMRSFRLGTIDLALHRIPVSMLLDGQSDFRRLADRGDTTGLERVRSWTHSSGEGPAYSWREEMLRVGEALEPGAYLLRGTAAGLERRQIFFVSDLGLLVKRSSTQVLVSAASFKTGLPVADARVSWLASDRPQGDRGLGEWTQVIGSGASIGATDAQGLLAAPIPNAPRAVRVIAVSERHGVAIAESPLAPPVERGGDLVYLYTERPIYRPGQMLHWKAFARKAQGNGYALPDLTDVRLTASGPEGASVEVPGTRLSARGSADGSVTLPQDMPLGEYVLSANAGRATGATTFEVQEYRKPEFRVDVTPDREVVASGDEVRFQIAANYFFGAPVFGAMLRYNLFETRLSRDERAFDSDEWEGGDRPDQGFGRVLQTGETRTDIDGRASLVFTPQRVAYDRRLTLEVEVIDPSNRRVRGSGSVIVGRGGFRVTVRPEQRLVMAGQPIAVTVVTRDHLGKPIAAAVSITLDQDAWNPIERRYTRSTRPLATATVTTDAQGRGRATLSPEPARAGMLTLRARAEDAKGNVITDEATVWVHDPKVWQYAYRYPSLEAFPDRESYQPGDSARIVVNTDVGYAAVLAVLEGRDIEERQVVHLFGNTGLVTFPIRAEHAPNVYVSIHVRKGKEVVSRVLDLAVTGERRDLEIRLTPDRAEYRPRDEAKVRIETRDAQGAPVPAEVSLGVVDEAIYQLRSDTTPKPHEFFYGHRPSWVSTVVSFPAVYLGGASKADREVRRDFRDLAHWAPTVITGPEGNAEVTFTFPDNLTTWRLTSRGATQDTRVGEAVSRTLVTKDLVARLAPPRQFIAGDQASLMSVITNRTDRPIAGVEATFQAEGAARVEGATTARASIPAGGEARHAWRIEVGRDPGGAAGDSAVAVLTFTGRSSADRDALELSVPVRPRAVPVASFGGARVESERQELVVPLPADLVRAGSRVRVDLSTSPAAMALAAADALVEYPWGCTEQTANVLRPALALLDALGPGAPRPPGWENAERKLAPAIARLVALQNSEGGWGWWRENETHPYITTLALDALARAAAAGLGGDGVRNAIQRAQYPAIRATLEARTTDGQAYALAHLTRVLPFYEGGPSPDAAGAGGGRSGKKLPRPAVRRSDGGVSELRGRLDDLAALILGSRDHLSVAGLALAARGCADMGREPDAKALLQALMARAVRDGGALHWPAALDESRWFGEAEENTGYALSALLAIDPGDDRVASIVHWLARRRTGRLWRSTRTTGPVAIALAEHLQTHPDEVRPDGQLTVAWNGQTVLERTLSAEDAFARPLQIALSGRALQPGDNRLSITRKGRSGVSVGWQATAMVPSPGPDAAGSPLGVTRQYLGAERTADRRGRPQILSSALESGQSFAVGDLVLVRLTLTASTALDHVMIEDPRPAGFEVEALQPEGVERPWNAHAEERDDRVAFFLERLEAGETVIEYLVRPELEGRLIALPVAVGQMYDPGWTERSTEATLQVKGK